MRDVLTDEQIQTVIARYGELQEELSQRISVIRGELEGLDENIYAYSALRARRVAETGSGTLRTDRVERTVENLEEDRVRMARELSDCLARLEEEHRRNWRVHLCYESLPRDEYSILNRLYEKQIPWRSIQADTHMSLTTVRSLRYSALDRIRRGCEEWENGG